MDKNKAIKYLEDMLSMIGATATEHWTEKEAEKMRDAISALQARDVPDINVGDMVSMSGTSYIGDGFFYSQEMREQARRLEEMTNPLFVPGSFAGVAYLRGGNYGCREHYGYRAHIGMTREELDMLHDAEMRKAERRQE